MSKLQEKIAERHLLTQEVDALCKKSDDQITEADEKTIETKNAAIEALDVEIARQEKIESIKTANAQRVVDAGKVNPADRPANFGKQADDAGVATLDYAVPITCKGRVPQMLTKVYGDVETARKYGYGIAQWLRATVGANENAATWCRQNGFDVIKATAQNEGTNSLGGFLVPTPVSNTIINLQEEFGKVRQLFQRVPMSSDVELIPRIAGILTSYWLGEGSAITPATQSLDMVELTAKKLAAFVLYSSEVAEDAMIDMAEMLMKKIAWAFSAKEDQAGLLGDGTSAYGGAVGVCQKLIDVFTTGGGAGLKVGAASSGSDWTKFVLTDFNKLQGAIPQFASEMGTPTFVCSQQFYYNVMVALLAAAGGNRIDTLSEGPTGTPRFLGSPVVFSQVMPIVPTISKVVCLYGNFELAASFGDRRTLTLAQSTEYAFNTDQTALRGTERVAINVHDVGGSNAASQGINPTYAQDGTTVVAGPVVGLIATGS